MLLYEKLVSLLHEKYCTNTPKIPICATVQLHVSKPIRVTFSCNGKQVTQYCYFENNVAHFSVGTEAIDGPDKLLSRDYYIYFYAQYDEKSDCYLVIQDFDGPFIPHPHGEKFTYGIDSFTLL